MEKQRVSNMVPKHSLRGNLKEFQEINLSEVIGKGYGEFFRFKGRYKVVKGSRGSKKSATISIMLIYYLLKYPLSNILVVRKVLSTMRDSCYNQFLWAANRLKVAHLFKFNRNPLEITYLPTNQKILFRGLDDAQKIASVTVPVGYLNFLWVEEAYEITNESDFDMLDESIRGVLPDGMFKQVILSFNPWSEKSWLKRRFFDTPNTDQKLAITTNYLCNEFLGKDDYLKYEDMKINNPRRYLVAGLGEWGVAEGLIYENWTVEEFNPHHIQATKNVSTFFGLDFGYSNDPSAFVGGLIDMEHKKIYIMTEIYKPGLTISELYEEIYTKGLQNEVIVADCDEPRSIDQLKYLGCRRVKPARKGRDSINNGIQFIQDFQIIVHPKCDNFINEISMYGWALDKFGLPTTKPVETNNHLMDALRYGLEDRIVQRGMIWNL